MSRWVNPAVMGIRSAEPEKPDGPLARIVKYVPTEIVIPFTMFITALNGMAPPAAQARTMAIGLIILFLLATVVYVYKQTEGAVRQAHLIVSPLAFIAWSYALAGSLLGDLFSGLAAFFMQAVVIALSIIIEPK